MINLNNKTVVATEFLEKKKTSILKVSLTLFWLELKKKKGSLKNATLWIKTITREYILGNHFYR